MFLNLSPAQMVFSRRQRSKLPVSRKMLNPEMFSNVKIKLLRRQRTQKQCYRSSKELNEQKLSDKITDQKF